NCCSNSYLRERLGQLGKDNDRYSPLAGYNQPSGSSASATGSSLDCLNLIVQSISNGPQAAQPMPATSAQADHTPPTNGLLSGGRWRERTITTIIIIISTGAWEATEP
uniref:Myogenic determination factor 5 domain-containing protein n=1 Tax=Anopheles epiroticus TaxID=199890 RepID=A0A182PGK4_9DIPT